MRRKRKCLRKEPYPELVECYGCHQMFRPSELGYKEKDMFDQVRGGFCKECWQKEQEAREGRERMRTEATLREMANESEETKIDRGHRIEEFVKKRAG